MISDKKCTSCKQILPIESFYADKSKSSGYKSSCKSCVNLKRRKNTSKDQNKRRTKLEIEQSSTDTERSCNSCNTVLPVSSFRSYPGRTIHKCKKCESRNRKDRYKTEEKEETGMSKEQQAKKLSIALQGFAQLRSGIKKCEHCEIWRDESEFRSKRRSVSGTSNKCNSCRKNNEDVEHGEMFTIIKSQAEQRMQRIIKKTLKNKGLL